MITTSFCRDIKTKFDEADKNRNNELDISEIAKFFELAGIQVGGGARSK